MMQSRTAALCESAANIGVGLAIALAVNATVLPMMGLPIGAAENITLGGVLTLASLARSYVLRRLFERLGVRLRLSPAALAILAERRRQVEVEGWTTEHDDTVHGVGTLARAGGCYALNAGMRCTFPDARKVPPASWPWDELWWKPQDFRRDLVRAGALIVAELERHDRRRGGVR